MITTITTSPDYRKNTRDIDLGPLTNTINKFADNDLNFVVYKLSYAGKYIIIKGKTLAGSLILLVDTLSSFDKDNKKRFKEHLYTHLFEHIKDNPGAGRFRVKILAQVSKRTSFYDLLKAEQIELDQARYDSNCLNNQIEVYIPKYNESTNMYGWIPATDAMNFKKWLDSDERKNILAQRKK
jgi:hypothetical protein